MMIRGVLAFTLDSLLKQSVQQRTAMITERGRHERARLEPMWKINLKSLPQVLQNTKLFRMGHLTTIRH